MVEIGQYVLRECRKNNRKDRSEQYLPDKLAALLHCNRLFYPPTLFGPPIRAHAPTQASGNDFH